MAKNPHQVVVVLEEASIYRHTCVGSYSALYRLRPGTTHIYLPSDPGIICLDIFQHPEKKLSRTIYRTQ